MKNVDRWFILIGLLYGIFGFSFGIWVGIQQQFDQAHLHAHINLIGFASMVLFGLLYRAFPALAESKLAGLHFALYNLGAVVFLAGIPLAQAHTTVAPAAIGSLTVLAGLLLFLANFLLNVFRAPAPAAKARGRS
jgi:cbb3-type cytochrome oxidase subunit 1